MAGGDDVAGTGPPAGALAGGAVETEGGCDGGVNGGLPCGDGDIGVNGGD